MGRAAAWDVAAENFLRGYLLCATNKHRARHALAALGAYAAILEEDRSLVFFSKYASLDAKKKRPGCNGFGGALKKSNMGSIPCLRNSTNGFSPNVCEGTFASKCENNALKAQQIETRCETSHR